MKKKSLRKRIIYLKFILNFLLNYLSPTNLLVIYLSQKLDKSIYLYQHKLYNKYARKRKHLVTFSKVA